jgi:hypothetical protein
VGAGMTLGKVAAAFESIGLALPSGTCASVGVTGLTLSGGQGPLSRRFGLTCDHLDSIDLIDAQGQMIHATDQNEYSDYLWLARGGGTVGHHYPGILTNLYFRNLVKLASPGDANSTANSAMTGNVGRGTSIHRTHSTNKKSPVVWTRARIRFPANATVAVELLSSWHNFLQQERHDNITFPSLSQRLTIEPWIWMQGTRRSQRKNRNNRLQKNRTFWESFVYLNVYFFGSDALHSKYMVPKILPMIQVNWTKSSGSVGKLVSLERLDHLTFVRKLAGVKTNAQLSSGQHGHDLNHAKWKGYSAMVLPSSLPSPNKWEKTVFEFIINSIFESQPKCRRYAEFKPMGGAIRNHYHNHSRTSAFGHRDALWMVLVNHFYGLHEHQDDTTEERSIANAKIESQILKVSQWHHNGLMSNLMGKQASYAGYLEHSNTLWKDMELYYGPANAKRILDIKSRRDPHNIFRHWLSIRGDGG